MCLFEAIIKKCVYYEIVDYETRKFCTTVNLSNAMISCALLAAIVVSQINTRKTHRKVPVYILSVIYLLHWNLNTKLALNTETLHLEKLWMS